MDAPGKEAPVDGGPAVAAMAALGGDGGGKGGKGGRSGGIGGRGGRGGAAGPYGRGWERRHRWLRVPPWRRPAAPGATAVEKAGKEVTAAVSVAQEALVGEAASARPAGRAVKAETASSADMVAVAGMAAASARLAVLADQVAPEPVDSAGRAKAVVWEGRVGRAEPADRVIPFIWTRAYTCPSFSLHGVRAR
nr:rRNA 2'-O-methyltransferase fibrillarin-like [Lolium perenne]